MVLVAGALWTWARGRPVATGRADRAGHGHQALPAVPARPDRRSSACASAAGATWSTPCSPRPRPGCVLNAPAYLSGADEWKRVLGVQLRARPRPRVGLAGAQPGRPHHDHARPRSTTGPGRCSGCGARRWRSSASGRRPRRGWPSSASWWWPASCWSTRSTRRSTCSGCCRWPCWPGRAGATSSSGRRARSSTSRRCGGTSTATCSPASGAGRRLLLGRDHRSGCSASSTWWRSSRATSSARARPGAADRRSGRRLRLMSTRSNAVAV